MHKAEDESQQWPELHVAARATHKAYQATGEMPAWDELAVQVATIGQAPSNTDIR